MTGIIFVLKTGIPWEDLPQEMGCDSGMTCWRRLRDWQEAGIWESFTMSSCKIYTIRKRLTGAELYWRLCHPGKKGGEHTGPNPVDRGRPGSKHHLITDRNGIPLVVGLTAANVNDCKMQEYMLDHLPSLRNLHGRPTCHPQKLHADKGYDFPFCRQACTVRHIKHALPDVGWTVPLILESTAGLLSEPLPGSIDTGACSSDMNAGLISIWLFSRLLPL